MPIPPRWLHFPARLEAAERNDLKFDPGEKCDRDHVSPRYVNGSCKCVRCNADDGTLHNRSTAASIKARNEQRAKMKRRTDKITRARNIANVAKRREPMGRPLPRKAAHLICSYERSAAARTNSQHLDDLLRKD
jgi:hypothetical protein